MNFEQARFNMVEQQIRPWEVLDQHVLNTINRIPREEFVPQQYKNLAYTDTQIPLAHNEVMMRPNVEGRILQVLELKETDKVLEIGTGSGYLTACLAQLCAHIDSIDKHEDFIKEAKEKLAAHNINNVTLNTQAYGQQLHQKQSYDAIVLTGSVPEIPDTYKQALAKNGRLFAVIGSVEQPIMEAVLIRRTANDQWLHESLFETSIPPLSDANKPKNFKL